jgi:signal transduction histidine kinase
LKLKTRLIISFCIIIFVPVILAAAVFGTIRLVRNNSEQSYNIEGNYAYLTNSLQELSRNADKTFSDVQGWVSTDKSRALDISKLKEFNKTIADKSYSYLLVRKDNEIIFDGSSEDDVSLNKDDLPAYGSNKPTANVIVYVNRRTPSLLRQFDFETESGELCTVFQVTSSKPIMPGTRKLFLDIALSVILILVFTAILLIGWTYRGIVPRLKTLVKATEEIREGQLDHPLTVQGQDEISELFRSFEDMRKRLQANAIEKMNNEEEQRQLIRNIAHDLKTPITAVKGYAEGILDGVAKTPEKREAYLKTIYNKANEMNSLINELTLYSKIDTNKIPYNFQKLNVKEFFMDCAEAIGMELESQKIEFSYYNYVDDETCIIADPEQLERVIHNLIGNSVKYMGSRPGIINLRVKDVGDFIQIEEEDNGKGISAKDLPYIFDRMFRADASRNSKVGGSGIGLSIVKKIIEDHGGSIWATSKEDVGTVMYFVIRKQQEENDEQDTDH